MENYEAAGLALGIGFWVVYMLFVLALSVFILVAMWKVYAKAGKPGWACLVPFYNTYCLFEIAFGNGWLFLLTFVPCVNFVFLIMLYFKLAKAFGQGVGFGFGLLFLSPIFFAILAFGKSQYVGPQ